VEKIAFNIGEAFKSPLGRTKTLGDLVSTILSSALALASIILLFLLIIGGIGIMAGAGTDNPERVAKGKQAATTAVIGFIIIFAAYWIVQIIEALTGVKILGPTI
jgi:hypothetical protein